MKIKIGIVCMCVILCGIFWQMVARIEEKQTIVIQPDKITAESLEEEFGEGKTFEEFLAREDFGEFYELELVRSAEASELAYGAYYFADRQLADEITGILGEYPYYTAESGESLMNQDMEYVSVRLRGTHETDLVVRICQLYHNPEVVVLEFAAENIAGAATAEMLRRWYPTILYADSDVLWRMMECMEKSVETMSLELAQERMDSVEGTLSSSEFLCMRHEEKEQYYNNETGEGYTVYTQPLSGEQGYLELYEVYLCCSGDEECSRERFIYKVDWYDSEGNFQREMYLNMEDYNRAWGKGDET